MENVRPRYIPPHSKRRFSRHGRNVNEDNSHLLPDPPSFQHPGYRPPPNNLARWRRLITLLENGFRPVHLDGHRYDKIQRLLCHFESMVAGFPCLSFRINLQHFVSSFDENMSTYSGYQLQLTLLQAIEDWCILKKCNHTFAAAVFESCLDMLVRYREHYSACCNDSLVQSSELTLAEIQRAKAEVDFASKLVDYQRLAIERCECGCNEALTAFREHTALQPEYDEECSRLSLQAIKFTLSIRQHFRLG